MLENFVLSYELERFFLLLGRSLCKFLDCDIVSLEIKADLLSELYLIFYLFEGLQIGDVLLGVLLGTAGSHGGQLQIIGEQSSLIDGVCIDQPTHILEYLLGTQLLLVFLGCIIGKLPLLRCGGTTTSTSFCLRSLISKSTSLSRPSLISLVKMDRIYSYFPSLRRVSETSLQMLFTFIPFIVSSKSFVTYSKRWAERAYWSSLESESVMCEMSRLM